MNTSWNQMKAPKATLNLRKEYIYPRFFFWQITQNDKPILG
jgi:hypothetical protein